MVSECALSRRRPLRRLGRGNEADWDVSLARGSLFGPPPRCYYLELLLPECHWSQSRMAPSRSARAAVRLARLRTEWGQSQRSIKAADSVLSGEIYVIFQLQQSVIIVHYGAFAIEHCRIYTRPWCMVPPAAVSTLIEISATRVPLLFPTTFLSFLDLALIRSP